MIRLHRLAEPKLFRSQLLQDAQVKLWEDYKGSSQRRSRFQMELLKPIKIDLFEMSSGKCAYCETHLGSPDHFDIDNYRPKGGVTNSKGGYQPDHYFWLAYDWTNLLPCCYSCSRTKQSFFPLAEGSQIAAVGATGSELAREKPMLLDPTVDEPSEHLRFDDDGSVVALTDRGAMTVETLSLNRYDLQKARKNAATKIKRLLSADASINSPELSVLFSQKPNQQFTALLRSICFSSESFRKLNPGLLPKSGLSIENQPEAGRIEIPTINRTTEPFTIKSIEIVNFRTIENLQFKFQAKDPESEKESWMMLLGDNGVGKSSILQAIALTLCGGRELEKLQISPTDILRKSQPSGHVSITCHESQNIYTLNFDEHHITTTTSEPPTYLMGYGATRLLPKGNLTPSPVTNEKVNIKHLFDYSFSLLDVKDWLSKVSREMFDDKICRALVDILDLGQGETISLTQDNRLLVETDDGIQDIEKVSDGYKSIIALACDIMKTLSSNALGYHNVPGVVLIDELGNHLHPRWRTKIVYALRSAFPKLQFIVSTHEPLCLRGTLRGEVFVITRPRDQQLIALDRNVLPDHTVMEIDQLLTSDFFGMLQTFDPETEKQFARYYQLLSFRLPHKPEEEAELKRLSQFFAGKEVLGNTPQMQVLYELVNEKFASKLTADKFKTTNELKKETIAEIEDIFKDKGTDWL
jgi:uncharacterized protein (TIGR02646 family)